MVSSIQGNLNVPAVSRARHLSTPNMGAKAPTGTTLENSRLDDTQQLPLVASLRGSVLHTAGVGISGGGTTIAGLIHRARAPNTWKNNERFWQKWTTFCTLEQIDPWTADEGSLLRYLGWLLDSGTIAGGLVKNYISTVVWAHKRVKFRQIVGYTPLIQLALAAYQQSDLDRRVEKTLRHTRNTGPFPAPQPKESTTLQ